MPKKIVVIGPESTGKSNLCEALARHYGTQWVGEYARKYLLTHGINYTYPDLIMIAEGQIAGEEETAQTLGDDDMLFIDTDMHVMKVWSEFVYNDCDLRILNRIADRNYDLFLLTDTDLDWEFDELREYPAIETRQKLFHYYHESLLNQKAPWGIVRGRDGARLACAIDIIEKTLLV